jgi:hypothetical protein
MNQAVDWISKNWGAIVEVFRSVYEAIVFLIDIFGPLLIAIGAITAAQWAWNVAMAANPLGLIIVAIVAVVSAVIWLWNNMEEFRGFLYGFWAAVKEIFTSIATMIKDVFTGWLDMITGILTFDPSQFLDGITKMFNSVTGTAKKIGTETGVAYQEAFQKGVMEVADRKKAGAGKSLDSKLANMFTPGGDAATGTPQADKQLQKGASSISEGSKTVRNVTVNIKSLVEKMENHFATGKDISSQELEKRITEVIVRAVQGSEIAMSNG